VGSLKKAYIIDVTISTRVVVDIPDNVTEDQESDLVCDAGVEKIDYMIRNGNVAIDSSMVSQWMPDEEIPFGQSPDDWTKAMVCKEICTNASDRFLKKLLPHWTHEEIQEFITNHALESVVADHIACMNGWDLNKLKLEIIDGRHKEA
jgi:hypothetical protein